jgi:ADP-ribose pyrophosphatase YjhB (NUDIX family)
MESSERSHLATYPTSIKGVLLLDGRVLLVKNSRDEWELPGGRIDADEDHAQTLRANLQRSFRLMWQWLRRLIPTCWRLFPDATSLL